MVTTKNLSYTYDGKRHIHFPDIHCAKGEKWLLLGQSGSGKTTLLHLLGGLRSSQSGSIFINETDLSILRGSKLDHFRGKNIGIVFQTAHFVRALNVEENLLLAQELAGEKRDKSGVHQYLEKLNLSHRAYAKTDELSVGEAQRVNIARALINKPKLILADEPTSALDDTHATEVIQLLETQAKEVEATLLIVTHDSRLKNYFPNQIALT
jgi:putative ABC transport system ATP-binding protein